MPVRFFVALCLLTAGVMLVESTDGTTFENISFVGRPQKTMWDMRVWDWIEVNAFVFNASFSDGKDVEVRVNPEFKTIGKAEKQAKKYTEIIGRVPRLFRERLEILDLNNGTWLEGGSASGNSDRRSINLNTGIGEDLIKAGTIENLFIFLGTYSSIN